MIHFDWMFWIIRKIVSSLLDDAFHPLGSSKSNRHFSWEVLEDVLDEWVLLLGRGLWWSFSNVWGVSSLFMLLNCVVNHQTPFERFFGVIFTGIVHVISILFDFICVFFVYFCTVFARRILHSFAVLFCRVQAVLRFTISFAVTLGFV